MYLLHGKHKQFCNIKIRVLYTVLINLDSLFYFRTFFQRKKTKKTNKHDK